MNRTPEHDMEWSGDHEQRAAHRRAQLRNLARAPRRAPPHRRARKTAEMSIDREQLDDALARYSSLLESHGVVPVVYPLRQFAEKLDPSCIEVNRFVERFPHARLNFAQGDGKLSQTMKEMMDAVERQRVAALRRTPRPGSVKAWLLAIRFFMASLLRLRPVWQRGRWDRAKKLASREYAFGRKDCLGERSRRPLRREIVVERASINLDEPAYMIAWITRRKMSRLDFANMTTWMDDIDPDDFILAPTGVVLGVIQDRNAGVRFASSKRRYFCGHGRWVEKYGRCVMMFSNVRDAEAYARRMRYRIPHGWEWFVAGASVIVAIAEVLRLVVGDGGLLP